MRLNEILIVGRKEGVVEFEGVIVDYGVNYIVLDLNLCLLLFVFVILGIYILFWNFGILWILEIFVW